MSKDSYFASFEDVILAYQQNKIPLHTFVWVRSNTPVSELGLNESDIVLNTNQVSVSPYTQIKKTESGEVLSVYIRTTPGRILLNESFK